MEHTHKSVLLDESVEALAIRPEGTYVDGTLGRAGHSREIAKRLTTGRLICIDRDMAAIEAAEGLLAPWRDRVRLVHGNFAALHNGGNRIVQIGLHQIAAGQEFVGGIHSL